MKELMASALVDEDTIVYAWPTTTREIPRSMRRGPVPKGAQDRAGKKTLVTRHSTEAAEWAMA